MMPLYVIFVAVYVLIAIVVLYNLFGKFILEDYVVKSVYKKLIKYHSQNILDADVISLVYNQLLKNDCHILYIDFLERFLIYISDNKCLKKEQIINLIEIISPILQKAKEDKPYVYLDERERHLLMIIEKIAKNGETDSLKKHITDLSDILTRKQKDLERARKNNVWTILISLLGLLISIVGLVISIVK